MSCQTHNKYGSFECKHDHGEKTEHFLTDGTKHYTNFMQILPFSQAVGKETATLHRAMGEKMKQPTGQMPDD